MSNVTGRTVPATVAESSPVLDEHTDRLCLVIAMAIRRILGIEALDAEVENEDVDNQDSVDVE